MPTSTRYFETFARQTTIQGFRELHDANGCCEKGFWLLAIVFAFAFSILLIYLGCAHFFKEPVATTVTRSREGPLNLDVLYCPANWVDVAKLARLENANLQYLAYALSIFRGDNYPNQAALPAVTPLTYDALEKTDFTSHMQRMLTSILPINLITNKEFKTVWENLKLEERYFLNAVNLPLLIESMTAEQVGEATILYAQNDFVGLAQYLLTNVRLQSAQNVAQMHTQYATIANRTEYAQRPSIAEFFRGFGQFTLLTSIQQALHSKRPETYDDDDDDDPCEIAPLLCCDEYGQNCQAKSQYRAVRLRPTPNELLIMLMNTEMGNTSALYAYVQEYLQQQLNETKNRLNETQPTLTDQIWDYYQILLAEYVISESYKTIDDALFNKYYINEYWPPYKEIANFQFIETFMAKAALEEYANQDDVNYNINLEWYAAFSLKRNPKLFENFQMHARDNAEFQEFLNVTGTESSVQSMRNFFAHAKNASEVAKNLLSQTIANWVAAEKTDYANFLRKNNFSSTYDFLKAVSTNASQIIFSISLSDASVLRPPTSNVSIRKVFNQLGACFRFSLSIESTSAHFLKSSHEKVLFPTFKNRVYLNIYVAESNYLLLSYRAEDLIFFGQEALEDYPIDGLKIQSNRNLFQPMFFNMDFSVTDFVFQSKLHRNSAPCRSDKNYSSRKCVAACNDQYANGALECSYYRDSGGENSEILPDNICSIFNLMRTAIPTAAVQRNLTDWNLLYKCYADCSPACDQWYMKMTNDSYSGETIDTSSKRSTLDSSIRTMVERIGNAEGRPTEIPNGWSMSLVPALREAILRNSFQPARWLTCVKLAISTEVTMYFEEFTYTWDALFGIVGGQVGLVMGASAMSFVQLGYLFFAAWKKEQRRLQYKINQQPSGRSEVRSL